MKRLLALLVTASLALTVSIAAQNTTPAANKPATTATPSGSKLAETGNTTTEPDKATGEAVTPKPDAAPAAVKTPHTEMFGTPSTGPLSADPLLQPPPMPPNTSTLIGGIAKKVDGIRNRVVIEPFGSNRKIIVQFDERSHIYRDAHETTILGVQKGDRIYADTMLVGPKLFARNLRVVTSMGPAEASGQVTDYDARTQTVRLIDKLTGGPVAVRVTSNTELRSRNGQATAADIRPGALVSVIFSPGSKGSDARQISILAVPGTNYIFAGRITNFDTHAGILDVDNQSDGRNYEIHFPPSMENRGELRVGAQIAATASFDGRTYATQQITIMHEQSQDAQQ